MPELTRLLLKRGADLHYCNKRPDWIDTAATCAIQGGSVCCLAMLIEEFGVTVSAEPPPLNVALAAGNIAMAKYLLSLGWPLDQDHADHSPVMWCAVYSRSASVMKWVHSRGVPYTQYNNNTRKSTLHAAAALNCVPIIKLLLESGEVDIDEADQEGETYGSSCWFLIVICLSLSLPSSSSSSQYLLF